MHALLLASLLASPQPSCDDICRVDRARPSLAAPASNDPSAVPPHPRATRVAAGLPTGLSGPRTRAGLLSGPPSRTIAADIAVVAS